MYIKLKSNVEKFSYILHKNPNSPPYEDELSCGKIIGQFLNDNEYEIKLEENNLNFLKLAKRMNLDTYLNHELTSVCSNNLKALYDIFRSVIRGTTNTPPEILTEEEYLKPALHEIIIGPIANDYEFTKEIFQSFDLNIQKYNDDKYENFETCFALHIKNNNETSLTEFLQKIYIICLYLSYNRKSLFKIDENVIEKIIFLSKNWLFNSEKCHSIINKFCFKNKKFKEKFYDLIKDNLEIDDDENIEIVNNKISLHERRHNRLIEKIQDIKINKMVDLCSSEGKLLEKVNQFNSEIEILGYEKDFYKIQKFGKLNNVKMIESNILYPKVSESDILPDLLTCVEAIEHFNENDRKQILEMIREVFVPNYLYLTTPNKDFNKFYNIPDDKLRRRDHIIEYTINQFQSEVVDYLSEKYDIEFIDLLDDVSEFENIQPSFCIFCTHKSITINNNKIKISKPFPKKNEDDEEKIFTMVVNKNDWPPERIEEWYNNNNFQKERNTFKSREVNYKKLKKYISMHGEIFLPNTGYNINNKELNVGYTSFNFIKNSDDIFFIAPTVSPVESLYKQDNIDESKYGSYWEYIEHPLSAFQYYKKRGITELVAETKYMGSRGQVLWFEHIEVAKEYGFDKTVIVNSRGGFEFFNEEDSFYLDYIDNDIRKNKENVEKIYGPFNFIILDCEILPWSYKAKHLINEQFRCPIESHFISNDLKNKDTSYINTVLNTLNEFGGISDVKIHPFHVLLYGHTNDIRKLLHGYHLTNIQMMDIIDNITIDTKILNPCEYHYVDLEDERTMEVSIQHWIEKCGKSPNEILNIDVNKNLIEGFVYKPVNFENYLPSGHYLQPALKVRGYNYLNLTYGINLYQSEDYFNMVKNRKVAKKRAQACQEFECSKYILNAFINKKPNIRKKYIAGFFGMETFTSIDRTL